MLDDVDDDTLRWWSALDIQQQIIAALEAKELELISDKPCHIAEKPWKYINEARQAYLRLEEREGAYL